jgi:hypothetical protein
MTTKELNEYRAIAALGILEDQMNPIFLFNSTHKDILVDIISGKIDAVEMARIEIQNRGLDLNIGKWIGWNSKTTTDVLV